MRPRKLTVEQVTRIRATISERRAMPSNGDLARKFGVSKRLIDDIASGAAYVPRETVIKLPNEEVEVMLTEP